MNRKLLLEKVGGGCPGRYDTLRVGNSTKQFGLSSVDILEDHDGCNVSTPVAVVGCRPHSHQLLVKHKLVAFMHQLMRTADELQVVDVNKLTKHMSITLLEGYKIVFL